MIVDHDAADKKVLITACQTSAGASSQTLLFQANNPQSVRLEYLAHSLVADNSPPSFCKAVWALVVVRDGEFCEETNATNTLDTTGDVYDGPAKDVIVAGVCITMDSNNASGLSPVVDNAFHAYMGSKWINLSEGDAIWLSENCDSGVGQEGGIHYLISHWTVAHSWKK